MKRLSVYFVLIVFVSSFFWDLDSAEARKRRRRRPRRAHTLSPAVDLVITFGDKVTVSQLVKNKNEYYLHFFNSAGQRKDILLSKTNYNHLVSQAQAVRSSLQSLEECPRHHMHLEIGNKERARVCLESDSAEAKALSELANTIAITM